MAKSNQVTLSRHVFAQGGITEALLGGKGINGLELMYVKVNFHANRFFDPIEADVRSGNCADHRNFCAIGMPRIPFEFVDGTSERAVADSKSWKPGRSVSKANFDLEKTMRLVDLTIKYDQTQTVGGPIDAMQLSKDAKVRWYQRKNKCLGN